MNIVHISNFYDCDNIDLACELYYVCELGKYLKYSYEKRLSLKDIKLDKVLLKSDIWFYLCLAIQEQWVVDIEIPEYWLVDIDNMTTKDWKDKSLVLKNVIYTTETVTTSYEETRKRKEDYEYDLRIPRVTQIAFKEIKGPWYCFDMTSDKDNLTIVNNMSINSILPQFSWVSLVAYGAVRRYIEILNNEDNPFRLAIIFTDTSIINERALSYILLLADKGKCFSREWFAYMFSEKVSLEQQRHIGYVSWYSEGEEKGLLAKQEWYSIKSKQQRLKELGLVKGSVLFLFERPTLQRYNYIKTISDCKVVIIEEINNKGITLKICNNTELKTTSEHNFKTYPKAVKEMYNETKPYDKANVSVKVFAWDSIGVEYFTTSELFFVVPLDECEDSKTVFVDNGNMCVQVYLNQYEYIYWLLEEYGISYDSISFKEKYFNETIPLYELFMLEKQPIPIHLLRQ